MFAQVWEKRAVRIAASVVLNFLAFSAAATANFVVIVLGFIGAGAIARHTGGHFYFAILAFVPVALGFWLGFKAFIRAGDYLAGKVVLLTDEFPGSAGIYSRTTGHILFILAHMGRGASKGASAGRDLHSKHLGGK